MRTVHCNPQYPSPVLTSSEGWSAQGQLSTTKIKWPPLRWLFYFVDVVVAIEAAGRGVKPGFREACFTPAERPIACKRLGWPGWPIPAASTIKTNEIKQLIHKQHCGLLLVSVEFTRKFDRISGAKSAYILSARLFHRSKFAGSFENRKRLAHESPERIQRRRRRHQTRRRLRRRVPDAITDAIPVVGLAWNTLPACAVHA